MTVKKGKSDIYEEITFVNEKGEVVPIMEKLLSITEIARYRKIPAERLRYYDRIGLLKPDYIDPMTGRRFYSAKQCENLGTIKELRNLNLSLKEIEDYFDNRSLSKSEKILSKHFDILKDEIAKKQEICRVLEEKLRFIKELDSTEFELDSPEIKEFPERYALIGQSNSFRTNLTGIEFMKLEETIGGTSPVLATDKVAMTIRNNVNPDECEKGRRPMLFCSTDYSEHPSFSVIPKGKYICAYHRNCYSYFGEIIMKMRYIAEKQGLELADEGIMIYKVDITLTDEYEETIAELQFPLN